MNEIPDVRLPLTRRLTVRLTSGVILVLLFIGIPFLIAFHRLQRGHQVDVLLLATNDLSRIIVDSLRSAMLAGHPHLLDETVRNLSEEAEVVKVLLLDHRGRVRVSSDKGLTGRLMDRGRDSTCVICHGTGEGRPESRTAIAKEDGRRVFRTMTVIRNEPACHRCHDPAIATNGLLLMDFALDAADRRFFADIRGTVVLGTAMVLLTVVVLVMLLRRMVHQPLSAMVATSQRIIHGDLDARAQVSDPGEFAQLAFHVNRMTDHLSRSIEVVEHQRRDLQAILDSVDDEILVLDDRRRIVAANEAFRSRCASEAGSVVGRSCDGFTDFGCEAGGSGRCPVQAVFETGRLSKAIYSWTGSDGKERAIEIHASPLLGADGTVVQAVEVRRDITERRQTEAILAHSEHLASLGLLATGLSHEINNPLGAISTSVDGLRRRLTHEQGVSEEAREALERVLARISREVQRGRAITHRLLKVARPPVGARTLVDVNVVIDDIVAILSHDLQRCGITKNLQLGEGLPPRLEDESRLAQVMMNVVLNAIQAMPDGGELRIATSVSNGSIVIEVEDTGCGIPPELMKRIYEPFFTTKPVGQGTGLGLFITHQIVTQIGGTIHVASQPGQGTLLTIRLPRKGDKVRA